MFFSVINRSTQEDEEAGASAVEYGLLVAAIAAIVVSVVFLIGSTTQGMFQKSCDNLAAANADPNCSTTTTTTIP